MVDAADSSSPSAAASTAPRRFAPNAAKASASAAPAAARAPSYVFLRVKRKRHEDPVESLLVHSQPELKRQQTSPAKTDAHTQQRDLLRAFTGLSTADRDFVFTRIDTLEPHQVADAEDANKWTERLKRKAKSMKKEQQRTPAKQMAAKPAPNRAQQQQAKGKERRNSEVQRARRGLVMLHEQQTLELSGVRVVDIGAVVDAAVDDAVDDAVDGASTPTVVTVNGAQLGVKRVLNPYEREVDEAVWTAFQHNDFGPFFRIFQGQRPSELKMDPAGFQRPADGGTILMAAARHGRADVIEAVLRSSAARVLQEDWAGARASAFARQHGHANVAVALAACEAAEQEKEYVYDVYCVDVAASAARSAAVGVDGGHTPVLEVSAAVQRWLAQGTAEGSGGDEDEDVDEWLLESDGDADVDDDGESIDSNHENHEFNDYPDEEAGEDSDDEYDSDDSNENLRRRTAGTHQSSARGAADSGLDSFDY